MSSIIRNISSSNSVSLDNVDPTYIYIYRLIKKDYAANITVKYGDIDRNYSILPTVYWLDQKINGNPYADESYRLSPIADPNFINYSKLKNLSFDYYISSNGVYNQGRIGWISDDGKNSGSGNNQCYIRDVATKSGSKTIIINGRKYGCTEGYDGATTQGLLFVYLSAGSSGAPITARVKITRAEFMNGDVITS